MNSHALFRNHQPLQPLFVLSYVFIGRLLRGIVFIQYWYLLNLCALFVMWTDFISPNCSVCLLFTFYVMLHMVQSAVLLLPVDLHLLWIIIAESFCPIPFLLFNYTTLLKDGGGSVLRNELGTSLQRWSIWTVTNGNCECSIIAAGLGRSKAQAGCSYYY